MFLSTSGLRRFAFAGDHHVLDAQLGELLVDLGFAVAAVGGDGGWGAPGAFDDPLHRRGQLRRIGQIALLRRVIHADPVVIVDEGSTSARTRPAFPAGPWRSGGDHRRAG